MASTLTQPTPITIPWASSGNKRVIPTTSQIGVVDGDGKASRPDGFPPLCATPLLSGGKPPSILDMNGELYEITNNLRFLLGGGCPKFDSTMSAAVNGYPLGAVLQDDAGADRYQSLVDGNAINFNTTPASIGVSWKKLSIGSRPGHTYTANDWCWLDEPGGLIFQWAGGVATSLAGVTVTLPMTFPHAILGAWGSINASDSVSLTNNGGIGLAILSTSQVEIFSATGTPSVNLYVIGR